MRSDVFEDDGLAPMREKDFQDQVLQLARLYHWRAYHTHDSRHSAAGFPDLVLVRGSELIFAELKTEAGRVTTHQAEWLTALRKVADELTFAADVVRNEDTRRTEAGVPFTSEATVSPDARMDVVVWRPSLLEEINARLAPRQATRSAA